LKKIRWQGPSQLRAKEERTQLLRRCWSSGMVWNTLAGTLSNKFKL